MLNISKTIQNEIEEKMTKIKKSTEMIKKQEQLRLKEIERMKFHKFTSQHYNLTNIKDNIRKIHEEHKSKYAHVMENVDYINKSFIEKQHEVNGKLSQKYQKQQENQKSKPRFNEYLHKRKISFERFNENTFILSQFNGSKNDDIIKSQHYRSSRLVEKNRSMNTSKDSIRLELIFFSF